MRSRSLSSTALLSSTRCGEWLEREGVWRERHAHLDVLHLEDHASGHVGGRDVAVWHAHPADLAVVRVRCRDRYRTGLRRRHHLPRLEHVAGLRVYPDQRGRQTRRFELDGIDLSAVNPAFADNADTIVVLAPV